MKWSAKHKRAAYAALFCWTKAYKFWEEWNRFQTEGAVSLPQKLDKPEIMGYTAPSFKSYKM